VAVGLLAGGLFGGWRVAGGGCGWLVAGGGCVPRMFCAIAKPIANRQKANRQKPIAKSQSPKANRQKPNRQSPIANRQKPELNATSPLALRPQRLPLRSGRSSGFLLHFESFLYGTVSDDLKIRIPFLVHSRYGGSYSSLSPSVRSIPVRAQSRAGTMRRETGRVVVRVRTDWLPGSAH